MAPTGAQLSALGSPEPAWGVPEGSGDEVRWGRVGLDGGTFETLKFSLQFFAEIHLLQEQFLQFVCEGEKKGGKEAGCAGLKGPKGPAGHALTDSPEMGAGEGGAGRYRPSALLTICIQKIWVKEKD